MKKKNYTFIDLFAGLGGFHLALESLGCKCVFASEIKDDLQKLYTINFKGTKIMGDITKIDPVLEIPKHSIICGGFPCQPFSQAGKRQGFNDEKNRGTMFDYICDIINVHKPEFLFLENVSNLKGHDEGNTWKVIKERLEKDYYVKAEILSPHQFGIPQHRKRIYIVCRRKDLGPLDYFSFPEPINEICDITTIIDPDDVDYIPLREDTLTQLEVWQEFIHNTAKKGCQIPSFPIWAMEFGATYDFKEKAPAFQAVNELRGKKGKFGQLIDGQTFDDCLRLLPNYAQTSKNKCFPRWKIRYIEQNREFYETHKRWLNEWMKKIEKYDNSHLKLEWNCGDSKPILMDKIIQFRASGIRVKAPTFSPALNLIGTQIPIFPWIKLPNKNQYGRYMTVKEAAKLQGMEKLVFGNGEFKLSQARIYEALGNAVNAQVVKEIAKRLLQL